MRASMGPAVERHVFLGDGELLTGGDADHLLDEVEPGDKLCDRVLDLETRVHLQEIEVARLIDDELDGAGRGVSHGLGQGYRLGTHGGAGLGVEGGRGCLLDHLLVAALNRALALPQVHDVAVDIGQHLEFDVAGFLDVLLGEHPVVAETGARLVGGGAEAVMRLGVVARNTHALAAAAAEALNMTG